jgi:hypothetical protein
VSAVAARLFRAGDARDSAKAEGGQSIAVPKRVLYRILRTLGQVRPGLAAIAVPGFGDAGTQSLDPAAEHGGQAHHQPAGIRHQNGGLPKLVLLMCG